VLPFAGRKHDSASSACGSCPRRLRNPTFTWPIEVDNGARRATSAKHPVMRDCRTVYWRWGLWMKTVTVSQPAGVAGGIFSAASVSVQKVLRASALAVDRGLRARMR